MGHYRSRADHGPLSDGYAAHNNSSAADGGALFHPCRNHRPVSLALQLTIRGRAGFGIIDEDHPMADKNLLFDGDTFANEGVRRDLASGSDGCVFLNLDEGPDLRLITNRATLKIHQTGVEDPDVLAELYIFDRHISRNPFETKPAPNRSLNHISALRTGRHNDLSFSN